MTTEFWATFSIFDHRTPNYKRSLVLFDRVVIPVATRPYHGLSEAELDQLSAEVDFLVREGRAVRFDWDPEGFQTWKQEMMGRTISSHLGKQAEMDTRYQLQYEIDNGFAKIDALENIDVLAVPVCGSIAEFENNAEERETLDIIIEALPVPNDDVPLEDLCRLRDREDYAVSLNKMRIWQDDLVLELIRARSEREKQVLIRQAKARLTDWITTYQRMIEQANLSRSHAAISVISSLGKTVAGDLKSIPDVIDGVGGMVGITKVRRPAWKSVADKECALAGVVYLARDVL